MMRHRLLLLVATLLTGAIIGAPLIRHAAATVTFNIPNVFATQSGPNIPLSQLDANFTAIQSALSGVVAALTDLPLSRNYTGTQAFAKGANLASAATLNLGSDGNYFLVTGTTTITAISTLQAGAEACLRFNGALQVIHNASTLILQGGVNMVTASGDLLCLLSEGGGSWREQSRRRVTNADGTHFLNGHGEYAAISGVLAYKVHTFTKNMADASGSQVVSSLGITPSVIQVNCSDPSEASRVSHGWMDATTQGTIYGIRSSGVGFMSSNTSNAIFIQSSVGGDNYAGSIGSLASGQYTITWTKGGSMTGTLTCVGAALG